MISTKYVFRLRVSDPAGNIIHSEDVREWGPAYEDLLFRAVLEGRVPNDGSLRLALLEPAGAGPRVGGFRFSLDSLTRDYPLTILSDRVNQIVAAAMLASGEKETKAAGGYSWEVVARESQAVARNRSLRISREPYPLLEPPPQAPWPETHDSIALAMSAAVAEQLRNVAAKSTDCERAFLLAGWVIRKADRVLVVADCALPVNFGVDATQTRITFSPASFSSAMRELTVRGEGRTPVGWAHNHPPPCGGPCPIESAACDADSVFFSVDDRAVHRCYFRAPYMVAVVSGKGAGKRVDDPLQRAWGWKGGVIREIEFINYGGGE